MATCLHCQKKVHIDLAQNRLIELASLWELVSGPNKRRFYDQYGLIASLITVEVESHWLELLFNFGTPRIDVSPSMGKTWCLRQKNILC